MTDPRGNLLFVRRARDLVKGPPVTCTPSTPVADAARLMSERSVSSVIVAGPDGEPQGIVTDRDLRTRVLGNGLEPRTPAALVMSSPLCPGESHSLEAIALRLGVTVTGRHSALGDALTTAEILARLLTLLRKRGVLTLGEALDAVRSARRVIV